MSAGDASELGVHDLRERLLAGGGVSIDRLPLLRVVFDQMAEGFGEEASRQLGAVRLQVESVTGGRAGEVFADLENSAVAAYYGGADPDARILVAAERRFVFSIVEGFFGADGAEPPYDEDRPLTEIETRAARVAFGWLTKALRGGFASAADVAVRLEPQEVRSDGSGSPRKVGGFALTCRCRLVGLGREAEIFVSVSQAFLDPMREALARDPSATILSADPQWAKRMKNRVTQTEVTLSAAMERRDLTLADIANFEVGQIIDLPVAPTSLIKLECEGQALFWCEIGQKDGAYTIRIEDFVDKEQEFIDDVLAG
jgi:flagellar motor switch protein FliM